MARSLPDSEIKSPSASGVLAIIVARVLLIALIIGLCLLALEFLVRTFIPQEPRPFGGKDPLGLIRPDADFGCALKPNFQSPWVHNSTVRTNSMGLRDIEYAGKGSRELRILSLGDSNAFGWGVELEKSYPKIIQALLASEVPNCRISVVNAAVPGYSTHQQRLMLERLSASLKPDFVLATFSASNDVIEDATFLERTAKKSTLGTFLYSNSHLVRAILRITSQGLYFAGNRWPSNVSFTETLQDDLVKELRTKSLPHEFIIIPARHQIRPQVKGASLMLSKLGMDWLLTYQNARIAQNFRRLQVPFVDTLPSLLKRDKVQRVTFVDDNHPNEIGHQIIAQRVYERIKARIKKLAETKCPASR